ncbi:hypothetical protein FVEG_14075 [Fusarium verticillioides 7600]|uniref:Ubiquitin-like protease family profile domain-containing protein n=1 Tax=Gibberella moniliformis (strain M3125 / FGSC 7600) TaxID=334819 RepID=W7NHS1_GIBM7|nr:hypothetical protein FVEG_14075 [Fusarium verticillioides 7600]EWG55972.1 hypothetical protein FVEG_14075 [Fusarium verticillioides 7600]
MSVAASDSTSGNVSDRLVLLLDQLNHFADSLLDNSKDPILQAWHRLKAEFNTSSVLPEASDCIAEFLFASWAVINVHESIVSFACQRLYQDQIKCLKSSPRSRLSSIAKILHSDREVCFFVLDKQSGNTTVVNAFGTLHEKHPDVGLVEFCKKAEDRCRELATLSRDVSRQTLVRETFKGFGSDIWPGAATRQAIKISGPEDGSKGQTAVSARASAHASVKRSASRDSCLERQTSPVRNNPKSPTASPPVSPPAGLSLDLDDDQGPISSPELGRRYDLSEIPAIDDYDYDISLNPRSPSPGRDLEMMTFSPLHGSDAGESVGGNSHKSTKRKVDISIIPPNKRLVTKFDPWKPSKKSPRVVAPLQQLLHSSKTRLSPEQDLDDIIVNTAISRLSSPSVAVMDSLFPESAQQQHIAQSQGLFGSKSVVLIPACDRSSHHWRLYCWRHPATLEVLDSMRTLVDNTTTNVKDAIAAVTGIDDINVSYVECTQQPNAFDCGLYTVKFAQQIASGHDPALDSMPFESTAYRAYITSGLLTSESASLPPWTPSGQQLFPIMMRLWKRRNAYRLLDQSPSLLPAVCNLDLCALEQMQVGLEILYTTSQSYHSRHQTLLTQAIQGHTNDRSVSAMPAYAGLDALKEFCRIRQRLSDESTDPGANESQHMNAAQVSVQLHVDALERELKEKQRLLHEDTQAAYRECVVSILILRYTRKKFDRLHGAFLEKKSC